MSSSKKYPEHWGSPPQAQTRDFVSLPAGFGHGSGTVRSWILQKMKEDEESNHPDRLVVTQGRMQAPTPLPNCIGKTGEEAKKEILDADSSLKVHVVSKNAIVTMDYRLDRVRVFVDEDGKVARQPQRG